MIKGRIENSLVVQAWLRISSIASSAKEGVERIYKSSCFSKISGAFCSGFAVSFRYSFLGRVTRVDPGERETGYHYRARALTSSACIAFFVKMRANCRNGIGVAVNESSVAKAAGDAKGGAPLLTIQTAGIVVFTAVAVNIIFSFFLRSDIGTLGWGARALFLLLGLGGLFSDASWQEIKKTSLFLK